MSRRRSGVKRGADLVAINTYLRVSQASFEDVTPPALVQPSLIFNIVVGENGDSIFTASCDMLDEDIEAFDNADSHCSVSPPKVIFRSLTALRARRSAF